MTNKKTGWTANKFKGVKMSAFLWHNGKSVTARGAVLSLQREWNPCHLSKSSVLPHSVTHIPLLKDDTRYFGLYCSWNLIGNLIPSHKDVPLQGTEWRWKETSFLGGNSKGVSNKTKRARYAKNTWLAFIYRLWWSAEKSLLVWGRLDDGSRAVLASAARDRGPKLNSLIFVSGSRFIVSLRMSGGYQLCHMLCRAPHPAPSR